MYKWDKKAKFKIMCWPNWTSKEKKRYFPIQRKNLNIEISNILSKVYIQNNNNSSDNNNYTHHPMGKLPVGSYELDK